MGGELTSAPKDGAPSILVLAAKDPIGANLDRVQIIKGWQRRDGSLAERIYDVAWSDDRMIDPETCTLAPVGSSVDVEAASYTNSIGASELAIVWTGPDFDAEQRTFYYARTIEIPRPRWSTYDAVQFGVELPEEVPKTIQDRAYSSPIWYMP
ncbi:MAG: DUF3604 domain-containing protein [Gammaproteobacteria bacterium]|nr:DUF3604 domain-containing protein [Gammaproteobacteria bacterium]